MCRAERDTCPRSCARANADRILLSLRPPIRPPSPALPWPAWRSSRSPPGNAAAKRGTLCPQHAQRLPALRPRSCHPTARRRRRLLNAWRQRWMKRNGPVPPPRRTPAPRVPTQPHWRRSWPLRKRHGALLRPNWPPRLACRLRRLQGRRTVAGRAPTGPARWRVAAAARQSRPRWRPPPRRDSEREEHSLSWV